MKITMPNSNGPNAGPTCAKAQANAAGFTVRPKAKGGEGPLDAGTNRHIRAFLGKFGRDEDGIAAVEGAMVMSMLVAIFVAMADISVQTSAQARLSNALRASVQYIVNEGRDLDVVEQLFKDNYGSQDATFTKQVDCSCAKTRQEYVLEDAEQGAENTDVTDLTPTPEVFTVDVVQADDGSWGQCPITCPTGPLVKYLKMTGAANVHTLVKNDTVAVEASYSVRIE